MHRTFIYEGTKPEDNYVEVETLEGSQNVFCVHVFRKQW